MSEAHDDQRPAGDPPSAEPDPIAASDGVGSARAESPAPTPPDRGSRSTAVLLLAVLLALVIAAVAASPFWAPAVAPLLPWGRTPASAAEDYAALAARVAALEQRPVPPVVDLDPIKSAQAALGQRVAEIEAAVDAVRRNQETAAAAKAALAQLDRRVAAIEAQSASHNADAAAALQKMQQLAPLAGVTAGLADRLAAVEGQVHAQSHADRTGAGLMLALLQMREAVEGGRPFPAEHAAFEDLARGDPDVAAAAAPLADIAGRGVTSRAELSRRLAELGVRIDAASQPAPAANGSARGSAKWSQAQWWWAQALDRMRGLVTIRRIGDGTKTGPAAAVATARSALAQGDLAAAISDLDPLAGADAEAAQPWLRAARERLAAEAALAHLQQLLAVRLGPAPAAPPAAPRSPS